MEKSCDLVLATSDAPLARRLMMAVDQVPSLDRRFTQEEDFFLVLDRPFVVGAFPIHHPVTDFHPPDAYLETLRTLVDGWVALVPGIFQGLSWFFDPKDLFHPIFVEVLNAGPKPYLFVLRPDLTFRRGYSEVLVPGGNTVTPRYSTRYLFLESEVLPLTSWTLDGDIQEFYLTKLFQPTWLGESGRGYFVTGQWLDRDISRLLSRAAFPAGVKTFPVFPLRCRYETLSVRCLSPTPEGRKRSAEVLEVAWPLIEPWTGRIQADLSAEPFRDDSPLVPDLREAWGPRLSLLWGDYRLEAYLNDHDQKEYRYYGE